MHYVCERPRRYWLRLTDDPGKFPLVYVTFSVNRKRLTASVMVLAETIVFILPVDLEYNLSTLVLKA